MLSDLKTKWLFILLRYLFVNLIVSPILEFVQAGLSLFDEIHNILAKKTPIYNQK